MTTNRSYRRAMTRAEALAELAACSGTQFDPNVVSAITSVLVAMPEPSRRLVAVVRGEGARASESLAATVASARAA